MGHLTATNRGCCQPQIVNCGQLIGHLVTFYPFGWGRSFHLISTGLFNYLPTYLVFSFATAGQVCIFAAAWLCPIAAAVILI